MVGFVNEIGAEDAVVAANTVADEIAVVAVFGVKSKLTAVAVNGVAKLIAEFISIAVIQIEIIDVMHAEGAEHAVVIIVAAEDEVAVFVAVSHVAVVAVFAFDVG